MSCSEENTDECASAPISTSTGGAPKSPSASGSHPASSSTPVRAAARPMALATVAPVEKPMELSGGRSSTSSSQRSATASIAAVAGVGEWYPVFWPQAETSQSAATPAGCEAPITQPKKRGPAIGISPGTACVASASTTSPGSVPCSGMASAKRSSMAW